MQTPTIISIVSMSPSGPIRLLTMMETEESRTASLSLSTGVKVSLSLNFCVTPWPGLDTQLLPFHLDIDISIDSCYIPPTQLPIKLQLKICVRSVRCKV